MEKIITPTLLPKQLSPGEGTDQFYVNKENIMAIRLNSAAIGQAMVFMRGGITLCTTTKKLEAAGIVIDRDFVKLS